MSICRTVNLVLIVYQKLEFDQPSGGVAILNCNSLARYIRNIGTDYRRKCGIIIQPNPSFSICVALVYLSCNKYYNVTVNEEYVNIIGDIEYVMHEK